MHLAQRDTDSYYENYLSEKKIFRNQIRPISNIMEVQGQCYRRTDNHVKRVSCRDTSSSMVTSLGLSLSVIMLTLGPCHAAAGDISCQGIRYTYFEKGLDTSDIPAAPQQGESIIILPPSSVSVMTYYCRLSGKPPSFCHRHINHLERCFPGQRYLLCCTKQ